MGMNAFERETIITFNDEEPFAAIYTAQRPMITKLKKNPAATLVEEGSHDGSPYARFVLPKELVSLRAKPRSFSPEERRRRGERLQQARSVRVVLRNADSSRRIAALGAGAD